MKTIRVLSAAALMVPAMLAGHVTNAQAGDRIPGRFIDTHGRLVQRNCPAETSSTRFHCMSQRILDFHGTPEGLTRPEAPTTSCSAANGQFSTLQPWMLVGKQIADLYNLNGTPTVTGNPPIVAIVDAYGGTTAAADLQGYRAGAGLPPLPNCTGSISSSTTACFSEVSSSGGSTSKLTSSSGWDGEIALDLAMVSSGCPSCSILLVAANGAGNDMNTAVDYAASVSGVVAISNSYGGPESSSDSSDTTFSSVAGKSVLILAASGDQDYMDEGTSNNSGTGTENNGKPIAPNYPASSPYVLAVGGTTPYADGCVTRGFNEVVWNWGMQPLSSTGTAEGAAGTGSGCSTVFSKPSFQTASMGSCSKRGTNDVSAAGDWQSDIDVLNDAGVPETDDAGHPYVYGGIGVYQGGCWSPVGGTSAATPLTAAIFARFGYAAKVAANFSAVTSANLYANQSYFFDVVKGSNDESGTCTDIMCTAGVGWDGPTGMGTPNGVAIATAMGLSVTSASPSQPPPACTTDAGSSGGTDASTGAHDASTGGTDASYGGHDGGYGGHDGGYGGLDSSVTPPPNADAGTGSWDAGTTLPSEDAGSTWDSGGTPVHNGPPTSSGSGCDMSGGTQTSGFGAGLLLGLVGLVSRRRRSAR